MENAIGVQREIKQNAEEHKDFLKDLDKWAAEMSLKDQKLKEEKMKRLAKEANKEDVASASPPVAASTNIPMKHATNKSKPKKPRKEKSVKIQSSSDVPSPAKKEKIKAYDYDKWDKFDVDAECDKLDADASASSSEDELELEEEMENQRLIQQAVAEKERGNSFFKQGNLDKAIERYTAGIQCNPYCPILPANRSMALLKKGQFSAAEKDASLSLSLDPSYIKALQRRASARIGLKKTKAAIMDYEKILELEPTNKQAASELTRLKEVHNSPTEDKNEDKKPAVEAKVPEKINLKANMKSMFKQNYKTERLEADNEDGTPASLILSTGSGSTEGLPSHSHLPPAPWPTVEPSLAVLPVNKPAHLRSKKPLQKITVQETASNPSSKASAIATRQSDSSLISETKSESPLKITKSEAVSSTTALATSNTPSSTTSTTTLTQAVSSNSALESSPSVDKPATKGKRIQIVEVDGETNDNDSAAPAEHVEEELEAIEPGDGFKSRSKGLCRRVEKELNESSHLPSQVNNQTKVPSVPKTSAQFYRDWRSIKSNDNRFEFLAQLTSDSYQQIFKNQMESSSFSEIIAVLAQGDLAPRQAADHLVGLSRLPRIATLVMFMEKTEKANLTTLLARADSALSQEERTHIKKIFSL